MAWISAAAIIGLGTVAGVSVANASDNPMDRDARGVSRPATVAATQVAGSTASSSRTALAKAKAAARERALLAGRTRVIKAVLARFPHARILRIVRHRNHSWLVTLQLRTHRIGVVLVDRHLRVGPFIALRKPARHLPVIVTPAPTPPLPTTVPAPVNPVPSPTFTTGPHW
jgi:hypothetical protein